MIELQFRPITVEDKALIIPFTFASGLQNCDLAFSNMCSWRFLYDSEYAIYKNQLLIRFWIEGKKRVAYMRPIGEGDFREAVNLLEEDSLKQGHPLCLLGVTPVSKKLLNETFPDEFIYIVERDYFDYIYLREELATLKGKKFQQKRNHINKFKKQYAYEYLPLTPEIIPDCLAFESQWYQVANLSGKDAEELAVERQSMIFALTHFRELGLHGGAIRIENKIVAFTFGSPINPNTFGVHVEKADTNFDGSYTIINQEFAAHLPEQYIYLNREEDLGISGLRKAKLSYNPTILLEKCAAIKKRRKE